MSNNNNGNYFDVIIIIRRALRANLQIHIIEMWNSVSYPIERHDSSILERILLLDIGLSYLLSNANSRGFWTRIGEFLSPLRVDRLYNYIASLICDMKSVCDENVHIREKHVTGRLHE